MTVAASYAPVMVLPPNVDEQEWLAARSKGVGASEVGAVVGLSPYEGPLRVWLRKVAGLETPDNPAMRWGRRFEDDVLEEHAMLHPDVAVTVKPGLFSHPDSPWRLVTPDWIGEDDDGRFLGETKTGLSYGETWGDEGTDEIPPQYLCQVTQGCDVMGLRRWRLIVLLLDRREYREYGGDFDDEFAAHLRDRVDSFWRYNVLGGVEPAADGLLDTTELLAQRYNSQREVPVELDREAQMWVTSYRVNHEALDEREQAKNEAGNLLRQYLTSRKASVGLVNGEQVVTYQKPKKSKRDDGGRPSLRVKGVSW